MPPKLMPGSPVDVLTSLQSIVEPLTVEGYNEVYVCLAAATMALRGRSDWSTRNRAEKLLELAKDIARCREAVK